MNIKLHTPKSLKAGSGMASTKQFMLSLLATTMSIALTFGTAAIVDNNKKQKEKREIVMMVMFDMHNTLKEIAKIDSTLRYYMDCQLKIAEDTNRYDSLQFKMRSQSLKVDYTETTEHIFSSSIESINTVGNVLFTENVAKFYQGRKEYRTIIQDSLFNDLVNSAAYNTIENYLNFGFFYYSLISSELLWNMQHLFELCKKMMNVTDEQIEAYQKEREKIEKGFTDKTAVEDSILQEILQIEKKKTKAMEELGLSPH